MKLKILSLALTLILVLAGCGDGQAEALPQDPEELNIITLPLYPGTLSNGEGRSLSIPFTGDMPVTYSVEDWREREPFRLLIPKTSGLVYQSRCPWLTFSTVSPYRLDAKGECTGVLLWMEESGFSLDSDGLEYASVFFEPPVPALSGLWDSCSLQMQEGTALKASWEGDLMTIETDCGMVLLKVMSGNTWGGDYICFSKLLHPTGEPFIVDLSHFQADGVVDITPEDIVETEPTEGGGAQ